MKYLFGTVAVLFGFILVFGLLWALDNAIRSDAKLMEVRYERMYNLLGKRVVMGTDTLVVIDIFPDERKYMLSDRFWYSSALVEKLTVVNATP